MNKIKFGTDGWRAIIAKDLTVENFSKLIYAVAVRLGSKYPSPSVLIGHDSRFGGEMFLEAAAKILSSKGIKVYIPDKLVSTPMISLGVKKLKVNAGIIITAAHFPSQYNGIKLRSDMGSPLLEKDIKDIEDLISDESSLDLELVNWNNMIDQGMIQYVDIENIYFKSIAENFDIQKIIDSGLNFTFDAMYGSGQNIFKKIMSGIKLFHCEPNPLFNGVSPEPVQKNLHEMLDYITKDKTIACGLAVDGDGSRIAIYSDSGQFISPNQIILLLIHYLGGYKKLTGKVVVNNATTSLVEKMCAHHKLLVQRVNVGFNEISKVMLNEEVLIGAEESGSIAIGSHIPDRDAVWVGLIIWQWLAESGKKLDQLLEEVNSITGKTCYGKLSIPVKKNHYQKITDALNKSGLNKIGDLKITKTEKYDSVKYYFDPNEWLLIRASQSSAQVRIYAEANTDQRLNIMLDSAAAFINKLIG